jgi:hypothetical protein
VLIDEVRTELRGAVHRGDVRIVLGVLSSGPIPGDALQLVGDGLVAALGQHVEDAVGRAGDCVTLLRSRGWPGDGVLADQLHALLGSGPIPLLRPLPVDLDELAGVLEGDPLQGDGRVDLASGQVWPSAAIEYAREVGEEDEDDGDDPDRWLWVRCGGSREAYRDMQDFIDTVGDVDRADRLGIAIEGRGAFGRFKDVLRRRPDDFDRWHAFSEERQRGRARAWLAEAGYYLPPRPWRGL